jgi:hypothetical protein
MNGRKDRKMENNLVREDSLVYHDPYHRYMNLSISIVCIGIILIKNDHGHQGHKRDELWRIHFFEYLPMFFNQLERGHWTGYER